MLTSRKFTKIFYSFLAFLLVFSTFTPFGVEAAGEVIVDLSGNVTEEGFSGLQTLVLELPQGKSWVNDGTNFTKLDILLDGMKADINPTDWNTYKRGITSTLRDVTLNDKRILTLTFPSGSYSIPTNQNISFNLNGALIEDWEGTVQPLSFTITAKSRISLGGTIFNATENDLRNGGKTIELNLLNATWDSEKLKTWTNLSKILDKFLLNGTSNLWPVINDLKLEDPNKFVSFSSDNKTLKITLPPFKNTYSKSTVVFKYDEDDSLDDYINLTSGATKLYAGKPLSFTVSGVTLGNITSTQNNLDEATIITSGATATIKLELTNGALWNELTSYNLGLLKDAIKVNNQSIQWEEIKKKLDLTNVVVDTNKTVLTITLPTVDKILYSLTEDQIIKFKVPYQLLQNAVDLPEQQFTITASPKALIKGTVTPSVSQADIIKGGKTIIVELVNANWSSDIATNTTKREALLGGFTWATSIEEVIKASSDVKRTSDKVVTITLPPISGYKIENKVLMNFKQNFNRVNVDHLTNEIVDFNSGNGFEIALTNNQTAKISGSILNNTTDFDIANGGKSITITLNNDVWVNNIDPSKFIFQDTKGNVIPLKILTTERKSDSVVNLILDKANLSMDEDLTASITIPNELLSVRSTPLIVESAFKIAAVKAELTGTALQSLDSTELNKGGKTIIITLNNANFNTNDPNFKNTLIESIASDDNTVLLSSLKAILRNNNKDIIVSKNKVTIKLPAVSYSGDNGGKFKIGVPYSLIENTPYNTGLLPAGEISVGRVAKATLLNNSLSVSSILNSTNTFSIVLDGTTWDPTITTNTTKQATLLKGLSTDDQTNEWAKITAAIKKNGTFTLDSSTKLSITIPTVSDYAIVRKQIVDIKIPKTVLVEHKYDIEIPVEKITISVPQVTSQQSFGKLLSENFNEYIKTDFEKIRVIVPNKKIQTITSNTISISKSQTITTIEVVPFDNLLTKVVLTYKSLPASGEGEATENTLEATKLNGKFMFILNNLPKNTEMQFSSYGSGSEKIQADIFKKIGSGNKVFNEIPKKDLTGSYSLYTLLTDKNLMKDILKYYSADDLIIGK